MVEGRQIVVMPGVALSYNNVSSMVDGEEK
jgi:hypothetical protein